MKTDKESVRTITETIVIAGHGQHSHQVPADTGDVVLMRDGHHDGTLVYNCGREFRFISLDSGITAPRKACILVRGQSVEETVGEPVAMDLDTPDGLLGLAGRRMRRRTTLYAAFAATGEPALGVWDFDSKKLDTLMSDRKANGEALPGEHKVRIYVRMYNDILAKHGWPPVKQP